MKSGRIQQTRGQFFPRPFPNTALAGQFSELGATAELIRAEGRSTVGSKTPRSKKLDIES